MNGGKTDVNNGAILSELVHRYIHSLPREDEELINNIIRQYKIDGGLLIPTQEGLQIQEPFQIDLDYDFDKEDCITIPVHTNTKEDYEKRQKFNRAKEKRKTERFIQDELEFMEQLQEDENER